MQLQWLQQIQASQDLTTLDDLRVHLLGKSGLVTQQLKTLGALAPEERKAKGAEINALKDQIAELVDYSKNRNYTSQNAGSNSNVAKKRIFLDVSYMQKKLT